MIVNHPLASQDAVIVEAMRLAAAERKGVVFGPEARSAFNASLAARTPRSAEVLYREDVVGGVPGWWCEPTDATPGTRLLYLHGGCYVVGSAEALRNFAGQLAIRARANTFVADYRLGPEHPFPAAIDDALAAYRGLADKAERVVVAGDSAGGGLALALLAILASQGGRTQQPHGAAVMSPWTDLALTGASLSTRAEADPVFTKAVLAHFAELYLQGADPKDPRASPLYGSPPGRAPPTRIDVGDDEVLLDDSLRYAQRLRDANLNVAVHVWAGMPHVFPAAIGRLMAANAAMDEIGAFLRDCLRVQRYRIQTMTVGIIGAGLIGAAFARRLAQANLPAILSNSRGPDSLADLVADVGKPVRAGSREEAAAQDLVLVAVNWSKLPAALAGLPNFGGRIVIDANNPIEPPTFQPADLQGRLSTEIVADHLPGARVVKAFNHLPAAVLAEDPHTAGGKRALFFAGSDAAAKAGVADLIDRLGFHGIDLGLLHEGGPAISVPGGALTGQNLARVG